MIAVGAYLQARRQAVRLTQKEVADRIGVTDRTISAWETGASGPTFDLMVRLLDEIKGQIDVVQALYKNARATAADGKRLALRVLTEAERDYYLALANTDVKRAMLLRRIAAATEDPELRARIEGYLDGLTGEGDQPDR